MKSIQDIYGPLVRCQTQESGPRLILSVPELYCISTYSSILSFMFHMCLRFPVWRNALKYFVQRGRVKRECQIRTDKVRAGQCITTLFLYSSFWLPFIFIFIIIIFYSSNAAFDFYLHYGAMFLWVGSCFVYVARPTDVSVKGPSLAQSGDLRLTNI